MATKIDTIPPRHFVRRCMACGYDGPAIRASHSSQCALCGCDLNERPPRSYAELEGFIDVQPFEQQRTTGLDPEHGRLLQRWVAFGVFAFFFLATLAYLIMAAMAI